MDLFDYMEKVERQDNAPLAYRMRPKSLEDFIGQEHILGEGKLLRRIIEADRLQSILLYGPPGTGKTSLAMVIANTTRAEFVTLNATVSGKKDLQAVIDEAKKMLSLYGKKTILFIDEIHRFNKAQQDYLLPFVEEGTVILIGATTENPYFEVNSALVSRSAVFELKPLQSEDICRMMDAAVKRGWPDKTVRLTDDGKELIVDLSNGDARRAYNALELGVLSTKPGPDGSIVIDAEVARECLQQPRIRYDKGGDNHYDTISAFIKSMRGSDPDATLYYLAKMIYAGEDIKFIARRIMICASEDVGMADPNAIVVATSVTQAVERIGMPEARILLAEAAVYVATAPKSNASYLGIDAALAAVKSGDYPVPPHLCDGHYSGAKELGRALDYRYAHSYDNHYVEQQYLPSELEGTRFFETDGMGYERVIEEHFRTIGRTVHKGEPVNEQGRGKKKTGKALKGTETSEK